VQINDDEKYNNRCPIKKVCPSLILIKRKGRTYKKDM
jgi:hypothetical protein